MKGLVFIVKLTFIFDHEKVVSVGTSEEELLRPMRDYAKKYGVSEEDGVFSKDGEDAFCILTMVIPKLAKNNVKLLYTLEKWTLNVDGEEDCLETSINWLKKNNPQLLDEFVKTKVIEK